MCIRDRSETVGARDRLVDVTLERHGMGKRAGKEIAPDEVVGVVGRVGAFRQLDGCAVGMCKQGGRMVRRQRRQTDKAAIQLHWRRLEGQAMAAVEKLGW